MNRPISNVKLIVTHQGATSFIATPQRMAYSNTKTLQAIATTSTGSGTANIQFIGSNYIPANGNRDTPPPTTDLSFWSPIGSSVNLSPAGAAPVNGAVTSTDAWVWISASVTNLTGTDIQVAAYISG